jgi:hypothetical protein
MPEQTPFRLALPVAVSLALGLSLLTGCGDDEEKKAAKPATARVEVRDAGKRRFQVTVPRSVAPGVVRIDLKNSSKFPQDAQIIRIDGGHTIKEALKVISAPEGAPTPNWIHGVGGVGMVGPGRSGSATQQLDSKGKHYVISTGGPGGGDNAPSAFERGAVAELKVTGKETGAKLPSAPATISATEYSFKVSGLKPGRNTIEFDNTGKELHHALAFPYRKGATLAEVRKAFKKNGEPPLDFEKAQGTAVIDGGKKVVTNLNLQKGKYALICFVSDRKGGPPHVAKGMLNEVEVR